MRLRKAAWLMLVPVLVVALATVSVAQDTPSTVTGAKTVTAEQVQGLLAKGAKMFDLRRKASYVEKHIPGAVHLNYDERSVKAVNYDPRADAFDLGQLGTDKGTALIFHGHGVDGWKGYKAVAAVQAGYRNVYFFRGGFAEWIAKGLPTE